VPYSYDEPEGQACEVRFPDPLANPYLGSADGRPRWGQEQSSTPIQRSTRTSTISAGGVERDPDCLWLSPPAAGGQGREFLKAGGVFDDDFIDSYIDLKMQEVIRFEHTPHPVEFDMYYSA
jgi:glutamine synthetase